MHRGKTTRVELFVIIITELFSLIRIWACKILPISCSERLHPYVANTTSFDLLNNVFKTSKQISSTEKKKSLIEDA